MSKRARIVIPSVAIVILAVLLGWRAFQNREQLPPGSLYGNGTIEATEVDVSSKIAGKVERIEIEEGDSVKSGQLIAILEAAELEAQVRQAEGALGAAEANLAELEAGSRPEEIRRAQAQYAQAQEAKRQAQAALELIIAGPREEIKERLRANLAQAEIANEEAERELRRIELLESQGAASQQQFDIAKTRRDASKTHLDAARQRLLEAEAGSRPEEIEGARAAVAQVETKIQAAKAALDLAEAGPRPETIAAAMGRVEQAKGFLQAAQTALAYTKIASPADAVVTLQGVECGEYVTPGFPLARLAVLDAVWVRIYIPEPQLGKLKLGQRAEVVSDTYPDKKYTGRVVEIDQEAQFTPKNVQTREERVKLVFGVKIAVENYAQELKPGMPVDAYIFINSNEESR